MLIAGMLSIIGVAVVFTASASPQFLVGKMINSTGLGMALASGQTYISEIAPTKIRGIALAVYTVSLVGLLPNSKPLEPNCVVLQTDTTAFSLERRISHRSICLP